MGLLREGIAQFEPLINCGQVSPDGDRLPAAIRKFKPRAPDSRHGPGLADLDALLSGQITLVLDDALLRRAGPELSVDETQELLDRLAPPITQHEPSCLALLAGHERGRKRMRVAR